MSLSIMESVREYLKACPLLDDAAIRVNFLDSEPMEYTIEDVPAESILKRYVDGSTLRQALFLIASREFYSRDSIENLKACGFYEQLSDWMEQNSENGILPLLPAGLSAQSISATTNGYCLSADIQQKTQRYQIQCKLTYFKEAV